MSQIDVSNNDNYSLLIQNGDFVFQNQELQHSNVILKATNGEVRQYPLLGVALDSYLGSTIDKTILYNIITNQLNDDGLFPDSISVEIDGSSVTYAVTLK